ncbi:MAG: helix-turn-helix domain-containing protein [Acidimicrobiales bacterium]
MSDADRARLEALARKQTAERRQVLRAHIVLGAADGEEDVSIAERFGVATNTVLKWRKRFFGEGIDALADRERPGRPRSFSPSGGGRGEGAGLPRRLRRAPGEGVGPHRGHHWHRTVRESRLPGDDR